MKDARAALDALRDEHKEKLRRQAEEAERQRQMLMAQKLAIMRKKKQEYLQYQRQLALQKIQEQEREMQMRQEQQKQQYIMGKYARAFCDFKIFYIRLCILQAATKLSRASLARLKGRLFATFSTKDPDLITTPCLRRIKDTCTGNLL